MVAIKTYMSFSNSRIYTPPYLDVCATPIGSIRSPIGSISI